MIRICSSGSSGRVIAALPFRFDSPIFRYIVRWTQSVLYTVQYSNGIGFQRGLKRNENGDWIRYSWIFCRDAFLSAAGVEIRWIQHIKIRRVRNQDAKISIRYENWRCRACCTLAFYSSTLRILLASMSSEAMSCLLSYSDRIGKSLQARAVFPSTAPT